MKINYHIVKINFRLIDKGLPIPTQTEDNTGIDLYSRLDITIQPHTMQLVPLNVIVFLGERYNNKELIDPMGSFLFPRSSLFSKYNLIMTNSVGVIDASYRGPNDEVKAALYNMGNEPVIIPRGERICQLVCLTYITPMIIIVDETSSIESRGGFGSTG